MSRTRTDRTRLIAVAGLVAAVAFGACGDDDEDAAGVTTGDLEGRTFVATAVEGHQLVEGSAITFTFDGDRIAVNAGCNGMTGDYTIEDGTLSTGELARTMMACEQPLMDQDDWIAGFLAGGAEVALDGDEITLAAADVTVTATAER